MNEEDITHEKKRWTGRCSMQSLEERKREVCPMLIHTQSICLDDW
jgi:hypothetical protein